MPLTSAEKKVTEDGSSKDGLVVTFTNGTLEQLEELREFLKAPDKLEVIKIGLSLLQKYKDQDAKPEKKE